MLGILSKEDSMPVIRIGLDVAKNVFQAHGVDEHGTVVLRKRLRRGEVLSFFASLPPCRRPIKMTLLCQIEMTLPGGFAELAYEPSMLKRARSNTGSGFAGWCIGRRTSAALRRGSALARHPTPTIVTSLSGRDGDISIWQRC